MKLRYARDELNFQVAQCPGVKQTPNPTNVPAKDESLTSGFQMIQNFIASSRGGRRDTGGICLRGARLSALS